MEYLEVRNFGPVRDLIVEIKDINILIGTTSSGKSTIAKLICIFNSSSFIDSGEISIFKELLKDYNIDFEIKSNTYIKYSKGDYHWTLEKKKLSDNFPFKGSMSLFLQLSGNILGHNTSKADGILNNKVLTFYLLFTMLEQTKLNITTSVTKRSKKAKEITKQLDQARNIRNLIVHGQFPIDNNLTNSQLEEIDNVIHNLLTILRQEFEFSTPLYIPAERTILSMIAESLFGLLNNDISLAKSLKDFGAKFEIARKAMQEVEVDVLNAKYHYTDKTNFITLHDGTKLKLEQASSGFQSLTPLYLVVEHFVNKNSVTRNCVTVEEPELNLYPTNQKKLVEFLVRKTKASGDKLIITTHSPYVVTTIDNLVQAGNVAAAKPEAKEELASLVSPDLWLDYNKVTCYFFDNGSCRSTLDSEMHSIGPSNLDEVSTQIGEAYERMLELKYS